MPTDIIYDHQIFTLQSYGGISRYFATLAKNVRQVPDIRIDIRLLYGENGYLSKHHYALNAAIGKKILKGYKKRQKWNKIYSKHRISGNAFDVFHPTYYDPYFLEVLKKPLVVTVHDMIHELFPEYFSPDDPTALHKRLVLERADHIIAISETTRQDLLSLLPLDKTKVSVIHHGNLQQSEGIHSGHHKESNQAPYILFVGAREGYKNFNRFLQALPGLLNRFPDLKVLCLGGGAWRSAELEAIRRLGITGRIRQLTCSDVVLQQYYRNALAFIYPSLYEGFGLPILEAFRQTCPVILSDIPTFREVAGNAAVYFDPRQPEEMAEGIERVISSTDQSEKCKSAGTERLGYFSLESCLQKTYDVYRRVSTC